MSYAIGVDVGGTFTDLVAVDDRGLVTTAKAPSTPDDQTVGVLHGLEALAGRLGTSAAGMLGETSYIVHGTTVPTNTIIEFSGTKTGIITTKGFRDVIDVRRGFKE